MNREQRECDRRARECLRRDDGNLRISMQIDAAAAFARDRAADDVHDAEDATALAFHFLYSGESVEGLARLDLGDIQRVLLNHWNAIAKLRGGFRLRRNSRDLLDQMRPARS